MNFFKFPILGMIFWLVTHIMCLIIVLREVAHCYDLFFILKDSVGTSEETKVLSEKVNSSHYLYTTGI